MTILILATPGFREEQEVQESFDTVMNMIFTPAQSQSEAKTMSTFTLPDGASAYIPHGTIVRVIDNAS